MWIKRFLRKKLKGLYHVHSFESLLENERKNLEAAYDQQKSQHLKKGEHSWQALLEGAARSSKEQMESRLSLVMGTGGFNDQLQSKYKE